MEALSYLGLGGGDGGLELDAGVDTLGMMYAGEINTDGLVRRGFTELTRVDLNKGKLVQWYRDKNARILVRPGYLRVEVSLPKVRGQKHNVVPVRFDQVMGEAKVLEEIVQDSLNQGVPLLAEGRPYRVDYAYDFKGVGNKRQYIQAFGNVINLPRGKKAVYGLNETSFAWTKSLAVRLYDKELEESGNPTAFDRMRFEVSLRGTDGISRSVVRKGIDCRESVIREYKKKMRLTDVVNLQQAKYIALMVLKRGFRPEDRRVKIMGHEMLLKRLASEYKPEKAQRMYFAFMYASRFGWDALRKYYSQASYYRLKREIAELGVVEDQNLDYLSKEFVVDFSLMFDLLEKVA